MIGSESYGLMKPVNRICSDGIKYHWADRRDGHSERGIEPTVKFGGGNVMVWGCMTYGGVGRIARIDGRMNAEAYKNILDQNLLLNTTAASSDASDARCNLRDQFAPSP